MTWDRGLLKSGALAVLLTAVFSLLVFGLDRWTGGAPAGSSAVKVLPHVAMGTPNGSALAYRTIVQVVNPRSDAVTLSVFFFNEDGSPSNATFGSTAEFAPTFEQRLENLKLPSNAALVISADTAGAYAARWGKIVSSANVHVSTTFECLRIATGEVISRAGVDASDSDLRRFGIPRVHDAGRGLDTSFAIVNTAETPGKLTGTLRDASGAILQTRTRDFGPHEHISVFAHQFFELTGEAPGTSYQFVTFDSPSPHFAAIALGIEGTSITNLPVSRFDP
jgi:hypothetical protein